MPETLDASKARESKALPDFAPELASHEDLHAVLSHKQMLKLSASGEEWELVALPQGWQLRGRFSAWQESCPVVSVSYYVLNAEDKVQLAYYPLARYAGSCDVICPSAGGANWCKVEYTHSALHTATQTGAPKYVDHARERRESAVVERRIIQLRHR